MEKRVLGNFIITYYRTAAPAEYVGNTSLFKPGTRTEQIQADTQSIGKKLIGSRILQREAHGCILFLLQSLICLNTFCYYFALSF